MKTFVILYIMLGVNSTPQKVAWFESFDKCVEVMNHAKTHADGYFAPSYTCVEYPDQADGWYK